MKRGNKMNGKEVYAEYKKAVDRIYCVCPYCKKKFVADFEVENKITFKNSMKPNGWIRIDENGVRINGGI